MNFRSDVASSASHPIAAMVWINQIDSAKSFADLKMSYAVTGAKLQTNFEVVESKMASGLKKIIDGDFKRRVFTQEEAAQKEKHFSTGRQVAWMICEYFNCEGRIER